jgi:glycosyltransferase involved in cell wall biosynthesis
MKLLFLSHGFDAPGFRLIEELLRRGIQVEVMCAEQSGCGYCERLLERGVPIERLVFRSKLDWTALRQLRQKLRTGGFDLVQTMTSRTLAGALLARLGLRSPPRVVACRGIMDRISRFDPANWLTYLNPALDGVACVSESTRLALLASGLPDEKLQTTYLGWDMPQDDSPDRTALRQAGVPDQAFAVGFVGAIRPVKGVDVLLAAMQRLKDRPNLHLVLVGRMDDPAVAHAVEHPSLRQRVHVLGVRGDVNQLLRGMDLLVMPSRHEGFGKAVVEAMRYGLCSVVSNVGGLPEIIRHEHEGLVVPPNDASALASAIAQLQDCPELRRQYGVAAQKRVREVFNVERMTERHCELYDRILNHSQRAAA